MKNQPQLIAYVDRFSGAGLREFQSLLQGPLKGAFGGAHLLPFFHSIDGADAGFDPIDHTRVDPRLGTWDDVRALGEHVEIMADLIVNHISSRSPQFLDYDQHGDESPYAGMFLNYTTVFAEGAREADLLFNSIARARDCHSRTTNSSMASSVCYGQHWVALSTDSPSRRVSRRCCFSGCY